MYSTSPGCIWIESLEDVAGVASEVMESLESIPVYGVAIKTLNEYNAAAADDDNFDPSQKDGVSTSGLESSSDDMSITSSFCRSALGC